MSFIVSAIMEALLDLMASFGKQLLTDCLRSALDENRLCFHTNFYFLIGNKLSNIPLVLYDVETEVNIVKMYLEAIPVVTACFPEAQGSEWERSAATLHPPQLWKPPDSSRSALPPGLWVRALDPGSEAGPVPGPGPPPLERRRSGWRAGSGPAASGCPRPHAVCPRSSPPSLWTALQRRHSLSNTYKTCSNLTRGLVYFRATANNKTPYFTPF